MNLDEQDELTTRVRNSALGSVSRREHARGELRTKLMAKFSDASTVEQTLDWLEQLGYLDDARFAEVFVRASVSKGRGPLRIQRELQQKGVAWELADQAMEEAGVDWFELAADVLARKFGEPAAEQKAKARQVRYLQYRGFSGDQIFSLFD